MARYLEQIHHSRAIAMTLLAVLCLLVITACGEDGDDEQAVTTDQPSLAQPTAPGETDEPTVGESTPADEQTESLPDINVSSPDRVGTPAESDVDLEEDEAGPTVVVGVATPADPVLTDGEGAGATPAMAVTPVTNGAPTGDGTTGAGLPEGAGPGPTTPVATAQAAQVDVSVGPATAAAVPGTPVANGEPLVVDSCEVNEVPVFTSETSTYRLSADLNFRSGPGSDCPLIGDGPLGEFSLVEVIGGPVFRQAEDEFEWVQIRVGDQTGWVAFEFLEPAE